jgi:hypothetical protein
LPSLEKGEDMLITAPEFLAYMKTLGADEVLACVPDVAAAISPYNGGGLTALKVELAKLKSRTW